VFLFGFSWCIKYPTATETHQREKDMNNVTVEMKSAEGKTINRTIDITVLQYRSDAISIIATDPEMQRTKLLEWIEERGNEQHETELSLVSWYVH
jgi:hypothetical protein